MNSTDRITIRKALIKSFIKEFKELSDYNYTRYNIEYSKTNLVFSKKDINKFVDIYPPYSYNLRKFVDVLRNRDDLFFTGVYTPPLEDQQLVSRGIFNTTTEGKSKQLLIFPKKCVGIMMDSIVDEIVDINTQRDRLTAGLDPDYTELIPETQRSKKNLRWAPLASDYPTDFSSILEHRPDTQNIVVSESNPGYWKSSVGHDGVDFETTMTMSPYLLGPGVQYAEFALTKLKTIDRNLLTLFVGYNQTKRQPGDFHVGVSDKALKKETTIDASIREVNKETGIIVTEADLANNGEQTANNNDNKPGQVLISTITVDENTTFGSLENRGGKDSKDRVIIFLSGTQDHMMPILSGMNSAELKEKIADFGLVRVQDAIVILQHVIDYNKLIIKLQKKNKKLKWTSLRYNFVTQEIKHNLIRN